MNENPNPDEPDTVPDPDEPETVPEFESPDEIGTVVTCDGSSYDHPKTRIANKAIKPTWS